jgi:hypothetical protein
MPAIANDSGQPTAADTLSMLGQSPGQSGGNDPSSQVTALIGKLRQLDQMAQAISAELPTLQSEGQQIRQIIRKMVQKAGQGQPASTPSSDGLPGGGG